MRTLSAVILLLLSVPGAAFAQAIQPGRWDVTSTVVDLAVPGAPGFLLRMIKGKSKAEHKCVSPEQARAGAASLLAPNPKAGCRVDTQHLAGGRYSQTLTCPQKQGAAMLVSRSGTYDTDGFAGRVQMSGQAPKGPMSVTLDQRAARVAGRCRG